MIKPLTDLESLEKFVIENDKLLDLEALVGRFNIFDALGVANRELSHSNFLAWLLDPGESHGLGGLFLKAVLMDLLRQTPAENRLFSPIVLDGGKLNGIEIRREWKNIDLLIVCDEPKFVIAIENKIRSGEHSDQLARYQKIVNEDPKLSCYKHRQFVYLTPEGDEPSEEDWTVYSYADLHRVLTKTRAAAGDQMGDGVRIFLDHYLRLIGSRLMEDEKLAELCLDIYKNHQQALDLIIQAVRTQGSPNLSAIRKLIESQSDRWVVVQHTECGINFMPRPWYDIMPPIGSRPRSDPRDWMYVALLCHNGSCHLMVCVRRVSDNDLRLRCVQALTTGGAGFGLKRAKKLSPGWNSLGRVNITKWKEEEPDPEELSPLVAKELDACWDRLEPATEVLRRVISEA